MIFCLSRGLTRPRDQSVAWLYCWKLLKVGHHPAKFGGHKRCVSGDIIVLDCRTILQSHMIKGSCGFMGRSPSRWANIQPSLVAIGPLVVGSYNNFSLSRYLARSCDKKVIWFYCWEPPIVSLVAIGIVVVNCF